MDVHSNQIKQRVSLRAERHWPGFRSRLCGSLWSLAALCRCRAPCYWALGIAV